MYNQFFNLLSFTDLILILILDLQTYRKVTQVFFLSVYGAPFTTQDFLNAQQIQPVTDEATRAAVRAGIMSEAFHIGQYFSTLSAATRASVRV